jgi:hypothetical protein
MRGIGRFDCVGERGKKGKEEMQRWKKKGITRKR